MTTLTAVVEQDPVTGLYVGIVPGLPGAHTQGATLDELVTSLREVAELVLEEDESLKDRLQGVVGVKVDRVLGERSSRASTSIVLQRMST